jgi:hypothetical protein
MTYGGLPSGPGEGGFIFTRCHPVALLGLDECAFMWACKYTFVLVGANVGAKLVRTHVYDDVYAGGVSDVQVGVNVSVCNNVTVGER